MSNYRSARGYAGQPMQNSLLRSPQDSLNLYKTRPMRGVVIAVYPSDSANNYSSNFNADFRGSRHECSVQIVDDGFGNIFQLDNVIIPSPVPCGHRDYFEHLPKGSSQYLKGDTDPSGAASDLYDMDGDWVIVQFLGGDIDQPYIAGYLNHPRNTIDPQTCGEGGAGSDGGGTTLKQEGRVYKRVNGVDLVLTPSGDIILDTNRAGSTHARDGISDEGVPPYTPLEEEGGNVRVALKESASVEFVWDRPPIGSGPRGERNEYVPQPNPPDSRGNHAPAEPEFTSIVWTKDGVEYTVPDAYAVRANSVSLRAKENFAVTSDYCTITSDDYTHILSSDIVLGDEVAARAFVTSSVLSGISETVDAATTLPTGTMTQNAAAIKALQLFVKALVESIEASLTVDVRGS